MSVSPAPPVPRVELTLAFTTPSGGARIVDLATRALIVAVVSSPRWGREAEVLAGAAAAAEAGADMVEVPAEPSLLGPAAMHSRVPVVARAETADAARGALAAGAALVLVPAETSVAATASWPDRPPEAVNRDAPSSRPPGAENGEAASPDVAPGRADIERLVPLVDSARTGRDLVAARPTFDPDLAGSEPGSTRDADPPSDGGGGGPSRLVALDVTRLAGPDAVSEESLALAVGVRLVRTADIRRTRRVVEVMAHLLEARR